MKLFSKTCIALLSIGLVVVSCKRENVAAPDQVSEATLQKIEAQGFSTDNVRKVEGGYLVEGDIILTEDNLNSKSTSPNLLIANVEQYSTTNLVKALPRVITVSVSGTLSGLAVWSNATDVFISRYNALGLQITLKRVSSGGNVDIIGFEELNCS